MVNLKAQNKNEEIILTYLKENASDSLKEKINSGEKTLQQCWSYIVSEAHKQAENNCAVIDDATVFGWAIHFFEEDSIKAEMHKTTPVVKTKTVKTAPPKKEEPEEMEQLCIFDM